MAIQSSEVSPLLPEKPPAAMPSFSSAIETTNGRRPQAIAHRGYKAAYPENTLGAFKGAVEVGAHAIETDVHLSRDGVVVLSHDATLKRCFGEDTRIADCDWDYLKRLRTLKEPRQPMPRLLDLLQYLNTPGLEDIWVLLDIKLDDEATTMMTMLARTMEEVEAAKYVPLCQKLLPGYPIAHIGWNIAYAHQFLRVPNVNFNMLQPAMLGPCGSSFMRDVQKANRSLFLWTVNDERAMKWCLSKQIDGVITDDPKKYLERWYGEIHPGYCAQCKSLLPVLPRAQTQPVTVPSLFKSEKEKPGDEIYVQEVRTETWNNATTTSSTRHSGGVERKDEYEEKRTSKSSQLSDEGGLSRKIKGMIGSFGRMGTLKKDKDRDKNKDFGISTSVPLESGRALSPTAPRSPNALGSTIIKPDEFGFYHDPRKVNMGDERQRMGIKKTFSDPVQEKVARRISPLAIEGLRTSAPVLGDSIKGNGARYVPGHEQSRSLDVGKDGRRVFQEARIDEMSRVQRAETRYMGEDSRRPSPQLGTRNRKSGNYVPGFDRDLSKTERPEISGHRVVQDVRRPSPEQRVVPERIQHHKSPPPPASLGYRRLLSNEDHSRLLGHQRQPSQEDYPAPLRIYRRVENDHERVHEETKWIASARKESQDTQGHQKVHSRDNSEMTTEAARSPASLSQYARQGREGVNDYPSPLRTYPRPERAELKKLEEEEKLITLLRSGRFQTDGGQGERRPEDFRNLASARQRVHQRQESSDDRLGSGRSHTVLGGEEHERGHWGPEQTAMTRNESTGIDARPVYQPMASRERMLQELKSLSPVSLGHQAQESIDYRSRPGIGRSFTTSGRTDHEKLPEETRSTAATRKEFLQKDDRDPERDTIWPAWQAEPEETIQDKPKPPDIKQLEPTAKCEVRESETSEPFSIERQESPSSCYSDNTWDDDYPEQHCDSSSDLIQPSGMSRYGSKDLKTEPHIVNITRSKTTEDAPDETEHLKTTKSFQKEKLKDSLLIGMGSASGRGGDVREGKGVKRQPSILVEQVQIPDESPGHDKVRLVSAPNVGKSVAKRVGTRRVFPRVKKISYESMALDALQRADERMARVRDRRGFIDYNVT
ncbi:hypothetical protein EG329_012991 [Mollisiaceae sp. DMI_Dod_QoI]|nr:hypothetical protein EG329_012991 [Helotiales sp. DMI_Dod_QoI]